MIGAQNEWRAVENAKDYLPGDIAVFNTYIEDRDDRHMIALVRVDRTEGDMIVGETIGTVESGAPGAKGATGAQRTRRPERGNRRSGVAGKTGNPGSKRRSRRGRPTGKTRHPGTTGTSRTCRKRRHCGGVNKELPGIPLYCLEIFGWPIDPVWVHDCYSGQ